MPIAIKKLDVLLSSLFGTPKAGKSPTRKRPLSLEFLESREMLTAVGFHSVQDTVEGGEPGFFRIQRDDAADSLTVCYRFEETSTAINGVDFAPLPGSTQENNVASVTFQPGQAFVDIAVSACADGLVEGTEYVTLSILEDSSGAYQVAPGTFTASLSIADADFWAVNVEAVRPVGVEGGVVREVDPLTPANIRVHTVASYDNLLEIDWDPVEGAASYRVEYSSDLQTWWHVEQTDRTSVGHWNRLPGMDHYYRVVALDANNNVSEYSAVVSGRTRLPLETPVLECDMKTDEAIVLRWNDVPHANGYTVYHSLDGGQTWYWHGQTARNTYVYAPDFYAPDAEILFRVEASTSAEGYTASARSGILSNADYESASARGGLSRPAGLKAEKTGTASVLVSWNTVVGAADYVLETKTSQSEAWTIVYEGPASEYAMTNLLADENYFFRVRAVNGAEESGISYVVGVRMTVPSEDPMTPANFSADHFGTGAVLCWDAVEGAVRYRVQSSEDGVSWDWLTESSGTTAYHWNLTPGRECFYRVASIDSDNNVSEYSDIQTCRGRISLDMPSPFVAERTPVSILLRWDKVENASSYCARVSKDGGTSWEQFAWYTPFEFASYDISSDPDAEYRFQVRVWHVESGYAEIGDWCDTVVSVVPAAPEIPSLWCPAGLRADIFGASSISLNWNAAANAGKYRLERSLSGSENWFTVYEGTETTFTDEHLDSDTVYHYRVRSLDGERESDPSYTVSAVTQTDTSAPVVFRIERSGDYDPDEPLSVYYRLSGDGRIGIDYTLRQGEYDAETNVGVAVIGAGAFFVDIRLDIADGTIYKPTQAVTLEILAMEGVVGYEIGDNGSAAATIEHAVEPTTVRIDSVQDGKEGASDGYFRLWRDNVTGDLTVHYEIVSESTAENGIDFEWLPGASEGVTFGSVTFLDGEEYVDIPTMVIDDLLVEDTETLTLRLLPREDGFAYLVDETRQSATLFIEDNDVGTSTVWMETVRDASTLENGIIRIYRDNAAGEITVFFGIDELSTGEYGNDFTVIGQDGLPLNGQVTFQSGQKYVDLFVLLPENNSNNESKEAWFFLQENADESWHPGSVAVVALSLIYMEKEPGLVTKTDQYRVRLSETLSVVDPARGLLANDLDLQTGRSVDPAEVTAVLVDGPANGTLSLNEDGTFLYIPTSGFIGTDSFRYKIVSGEIESEVVDVLLVVTPRLSGTTLAPADPGDIPDAIPRGLDFLNEEEAEFFAPVILLPYTVSDTITRTAPKTLETEEMGVLSGFITETTTIAADLQVADSGWIYTEFVTWTYFEEYAGGVYQGGYDYIFTVWSDGDEKGYFFISSTFDRFEINLEGDDASATISGRTSTLAESRATAHVSEGRYQFYERYSTESTNAENMTSVVGTLSSYENYRTIVVNALSLKTDTNGVIETVLTGHEWAVVEYGSRGTSFIEDFSEFDMDGLFADWDGYDFSTPGITSSFEYAGHETYEMNSRIASRERTREIEGSDAVLDLLSITGTYTAEASSSLNSTEKLSFDYTLTGNGESWQGLFNDTETIHETTVSSWNSTIASDGEWALLSGSSLTTGLLTEELRDELLLCYVITDSREEGDKTTSLYANATESILREETTEERYRLGETVVGGAWTATIGVISTRLADSEILSSTMEGVSVVTDSEGSTVWVVTSEKTDISRSEALLESVLVGEDLWSTTGTMHLSETGAEENFMQAQQSNYSREIDGMAVSGTCGYTERFWNEYAFESDYEWLDEAWELTGGAGWTMPIVEEGVGWSADCVLDMAFDVSVNSDGLAAIARTSNTEASENRVSASGRITEWGFESEKSAGYLSRYVVEDGEWIELEEQRENVAGSSSMYGMRYHLRTTSGGITASESGGVKSVERSVIGYDEDWETETWGQAYVDYDEWTLQGVATGVTNTGGAGLHTLEDAIQWLKTDKNPLDGMEGGFANVMMGNGSGSHASYRYTYKAVLGLLPEEYDVTSYGQLAQTGGPVTAPLIASALQTLDDPENAELKWQDVYYKATVSTTGFGGVGVIGNTAIGTVMSTTGSCDTDKTVTTWTEYGGMVGLFGSNHGGNNGVSSTNIYGSGSTAAAAQFHAGAGTSLAAQYQGNGNSGGVTPMFAPMSGPTYPDPVVTPPSEEPEWNEWTETQTEGSVTRTRTTEKREDHYTLEFVGLDLWGERSVRGRETVTTTTKNGEGTREYDYGMTKTVDVKNETGADTGSYFEQNVEGVKWTQTLEEDDEGDWIVLSGTGSESGSRDWNFDYRFAPVTTEKNGATTTVESWGEGDYNDAYTSVIVYDTETEEWILTGGSGTGEGRIEHHGRQEFTDNYVASGINNPLLLENPTGPCQIERLAELTYTETLQAEHRVEGGRWQTDTRLTTVDERHDEYESEFHVGYETSYERTYGNVETRHRGGNEHEESADGWRNVKTVTTYVNGEKTGSTKDEEYYRHVAVDKRTSDNNSSFVDGELMTACCFTWGEHGEYSEHVRNGIRTSDGEHLVEDTVWGMDRGEVLSYVNNGEYWTTNCYHNDPDPSASWWETNSWCGYRESVTGSHVNDTVIGPGFSNVLKAPLTMTLDAEDAGLAYDKDWNDHRMPELNRVEVPPPEYVPTTVAPPPGGFTKPAAPSTLENIWNFGGGFASSLGPEYRKGVDRIHVTLDAAGMVPVLGEGADLLNAGIHWVEGHYLEAAMSGGAAIPVLGNVLTGGKWFKRGAKAVEAAGDALKHADEAADAVGAARNARKAKADPPNPNGKKGCEAHQQKVAEIKTDIESRKLHAETETRIELSEPGLKGHKDRYADVTAWDTEGKMVEIHQVGKTLKDKTTPIARERHAITDIEKAKEVKVTFHDYQ